MNRLTIACLLCLACLLGSSSVVAGPAMRRIAVIVGANDPPAGRQALHFAHQDAQELASVLQQVGGFAPSDVQVLLDPSPAGLRAALDAAGRTTSTAGGDVLFMFYYSGHSDGQSLYPHGQAIALSDIRDRVEHLGARIRVGILDTCRGGSWTQAKGLTVGPPLSMGDLMNVQTEGTALVSSSSGFENAHEADEVQGSFFSHYFTAGLRGAADRAGDGNVTLQEAFEYAKERTVRQSARLAQTPQHPSFDLALRGRQDIVLTTLSSSTSAMVLTAARAPMEVIHLGSGVTVADAPTSNTPLRLALPPGRYLVRSVVNGTVLTTEVEVRSGATVTLADGQLLATGTGKMAMKGDAVQAPLGLWHGKPGTHWMLDVGLGVGSGDSRSVSTPAAGTGGGQTVNTHGTYPLISGAIYYRYNEHVAWHLPWPNFTFHFGEAGGLEVMPALGCGFSSFSNDWEPNCAASLAAHVWTTRNQYLSLSGGVWLPPLQDPASGAGYRLGHVVEAYAGASYVLTVREVVTLRAGASFTTDHALPVKPFASWELGALWLGVGAGVQVRAAPRLAFWLDVGAAGETVAGLGSGNSFMLGSVFTW